VLKFTKILLLRAIFIVKFVLLEWLRLRRGSELEPADFVTAFFDGKLNNLLHLDLSECSKIDDAGLFYHNIHQSI